MPACETAALTNRIGDLTKYTREKWGLSRKMVIEPTHRIETHTILAAVTQRVGKFDP